MVIFEIEIGLLVMVLVGVIIVVSIEIIWVGIVMLLVGKDVFSWNYLIKGDNVIILKKGEEMGCFKLGFIVILVWGVN